MYLTGNLLNVFLLHEDEPSSLNIKQFILSNMGLSKLWPMGHLQPTRAFHLSKTKNETNVANCLPHALGSIVLGDGDEEGRREEPGKGKTEHESELWIRKVEMLEDIDNGMEEAQRLNTE